jgi:hypothetical protein
MTIVNDNSRVINKLEASLTDDSRVVIYNRHMFIVQSFGYRGVARLVKIIARHGHGHGHGNGNGHGHGRDQ